MDFFANKLGPLRALTDDEVNRFIAKRDAKEAAERKATAEQRAVFEARARDSYERLEQAKQQQASGQPAPAPEPEKKKKKGWF